ncbi:MAG: hypothetical protein OXS35_02665 [Dehalococcoidia bacterium]|nr:hypothetical protein [Dehalococcoidia bacterium]
MNERYDALIGTDWAGSLSDIGTRAYLDPVPLSLECRIGDAILPGCGKQSEITLSDGYGPASFSADLEAVMGEQIAVEARFGELARRSIQVTAPERILGVERSVWECYIQRGVLQTEPIPWEKCSGMWWEGVRKWDQPVRIWHTGDEAYLPGLRAAVDKYCPLLNLKCELMDDEAAANVRAYLGVPTSRAEEIGLRCEEFGGCALTAFAGARVRGGRFVVWSWEWGDERRDFVIAHELLHVIAPIGHRDDPEFVLARIRHQPL